MTRDEATKYVDKLLSWKMKGPIDCLRDSLLPGWPVERLGRFNLDKSRVNYEGANGLLWTISCTEEERERAIDLIMAWDEVNEICMEVWE